MPLADARAGHPRLVGKQLALERRPGARSDAPVDVIRDRTRSDNEERPDLLGQFGPLCPHLPVVHSHPPSTTDAGQALNAERQRLLAAAYEATPERFLRGAPKPPTLPTGHGSTSPRPKRLLTKFGHQPSHSLDRLRAVGSICAVREAVGS
jgi:hypothetical protein